MWLGWLHRNREAIYGGEVFITNHDMCVSRETDPSILPRILCIFTVILQISLSNIIFVSLVYKTTVCIQMKLVTFVLEM